MAPSLPVELLSAIFTSVVDASQHLADPHGVVFDAILAPIALTKVSKHWREVALNTSTLWTNFCITIEDDESGQPISTYLTRSKNSSIDIMIDARDPDWDFAPEFDATPDENNEYYFHKYSHPFTGERMRRILAKFIPHIARWRSLTILTDTYEPMHAAVQIMNEVPATKPTSLRLESLTLMRCNEFASHLDEFEPASMKDSGSTLFAAFGDLASSNLRHLRLSGVHVHWPALAANLPSCLTHLELAHHAENVRPSAQELSSILARTKRLESLVIRATGPISCPNMVVPTAVTLPSLLDFTLGYIDVCDAQLLLDMFHGPAVRKFTMEDSCSHSGLWIDEDASPLITACATVTSAGSEKLAKFPSLRHATLNHINTKCGSTPFEAFYDAYPDLAVLELLDISPSTDAINAIVSKRLPLLEKLIVTGADGVGALSAARIACSRNDGVLVDVEEIMDRYDSDSFSQTFSVPVPHRCEVNAKAMESLEPIVIDPLDELDWMAYLIDVPN